MAPEAVEYVPASQPLHEACPKASVYLPATHDAHAVAPAALDSPFWQDPAHAACTSVAAENLPPCVRAKQGRDAKRRRGGGRGRAVSRCGRSRRDNPSRLTPRLMSRRGGGQDDTNRVEDAAAQSTTRTHRTVLAGLHSLLGGRAVLSSNAARHNRTARSGRAVDERGDEQQSEA